MYGWTGKLLMVDLTRGRTDIMEPAAGFYRRWLGGRGLAGRFLDGHMGRAHDDPDLPLALMAGPLVGTIAPTSGRAAFLSRSPLTGGVCDSSVGGALGTQLKRAGLDGVVITGRAERLSGLLIADGRASLADARDLAGAATHRVGEALAGRGAWAAVGPAAENGSPLAGVVVDRHHTAGRGGLGLVMAAKGLKFLAVEGSGRVAVADAAGLKAARTDILRLVAASPVLSGENGFSNFGTGALYDLMASRHMMPTHNFRATHFASSGRLNAPALKARFAPASRGCKGCTILCKKMAADGRALPEFETLSHFTALVGNEDLEVVVEANRLCNELGLDTIGAASAIACWAEVTGERPDGARILALLNEMGLARGQGGELAAGSARWAAAAGRPEASMAVKGLELPAYDPRGAYGMALALAVATRGGCHLRAYPIGHEILRKPVATDRFSFSGKARIIKLAEDANAVVDSLTACKFVFLAAGLEEYAAALSAATGEVFAAQDLMALGERVCYAERVLNQAAGVIGAADDLPARFFAEAGSAGAGLAAPPLDRERFLRARADYYRVRGLDAEGRPRPEKAAELGVPWSG